MLFDKRKQEPERPRLQGEDFDIFPDLGDRPKKPPEEEKPPVEEPPPEPTDFQKKVAEISEINWKRLQIAAGILLGAGSAASIVVMGNSAGEMSTFGLLLAAVLALIVPGFLEKQAARKTPVLRVALILSLVVGMAAFMFYGFVINPSFFKKTVASASSLTASPAASATSAS